MSRILVGVNGKVLFKQQVFGGTVGIRDTAHRYLSQVVLILVDEDRSTLGVIIAFWPPIVFVTRAFVSV